MTQNMYRVGDYVYFETFPGAPYQIRRIEELNKTAGNAAVEAKVTCFFRRRDLPNSLLKIADQAERQNKILSKPRKTLLGKRDPTLSSNGEETGAEAKENGMAESETNEDKVEGDESKKEDEHGHSSYGFAGLPSGAEELDAAQLHELRQHELFLSRIVETLPATQIRGKCAVVILNEVETSDMYLGREDSFFYSLVYDPANQTLLADKGRIELGERYQAAIPALVEEPENAEIKGEPVPGEEKSAECKERIKVTERESVVYNPHHDLTDRDIDQFLIVARAVGTFSRALDQSSSTKLTTLHQTAAAASRDITLLHAMALLHQANYDLGQATKFLVPPPDKSHYPLEVDKVTAHNTVSLGGPILCRDQLEEWSAAESTLFEDAIEKYGKDFHDIRLDCLPWKSMRDIVEYYYMWKTTSRYAEHQKTKHAERENKLKQVYIPNFNKPVPNLLETAQAGQDRIKSTLPCESCKTDHSVAWYSWGLHSQYRLCGDCWLVWKKGGGLKRPHKFECYDLDGSADVRITAPVNRTNVGGRNGLPQSALKVAGAQVLVGQKGRVAFYLNSALEARVARRMAPKHIFNVRKAARSPFKDLNVKALQDYYFTRPLVDVLHTAQQLKRGGISKWAELHLTKLHEKRGMTQNGGGGAARRS